MWATTWTSHQSRWISVQWSTPIPTRCLYSNNLSIRLQRTINAVYSAVMSSVSLLGVRLVGLLWRNWYFRHLTIILTVGMVWVVKGITQFKFKTQIWRVKRAISMVKTEKTKREITLNLPLNLSKSATKMTTTAW